MATSRTRTPRDESVLVCVNYGSDGLALIQRADELARAHAGRLTVLVYDSLDDDFAVDRAVDLHVVEEFATEAGARLVHVRGRAADMALHITRFAAEVAATQVVIGQPTESAWAQLFGYSVVQTLLDFVPSADLHIVPDDRSRAPDEGEYDAAATVALRQEGDDLRLYFGDARDGDRVGIFYREVGTDFDHGLILLEVDSQLRLAAVDSGLVTRKSLDAATSPM